MKKKLKLKKKIKVVLFIIIVLIIGIFIFNKVRANYLYKQTYEYKLLQVGYDKTEIKLLQMSLDNAKLDELTTKVKDKTLIKILSNKYFKVNNLDRYYDYLENSSNSTIEDAIKMVNLNLDYDFYEKTYNADTSNENEMLVNKFYLLKSDYEPKNLVKIPKTYSWGDENYCTKETYNAFLEMFNAAEKEDIYLMVSSSYRSYKDQEEVYNNYKDNKGEKYADSIAARPGASEHQTGLALDIFSKQNTNKETFKDSESFKWLSENAYKYGFILRYAEGKENITGYNPESWHYRYVGKKLAKEIYTKNVTFEEYITFYK